MASPGFLLRHPGWVRMHKAGQRSCFLPGRSSSAGAGTWNFHASAWCGATFCSLGCFYTDPQFPPMFSHQFSSMVFLASHDHLGGKPPVDTLKGKRRAVPRLRKQSPKSSSRTTSQGGRQPVILPSAHPCWGQQHVHRSSATGRHVSSKAAV